MKYIPDYRNGVRAVRLYHEGKDQAWRVDVKNNGEQRGVDFRCGSLDDDLTKPLSVLNDRISGWPQHPVTAEQVREFMGWKPHD
jgi:hypothetical protein